MSPQSITNSIHNRFCIAGTDLLYHPISVFKPVTNSQHFSEQQPDRVFFSKRIVYAV